jgi:hypothetical protein
MLFLMMCCFVLLLCYPRLPKTILYHLLENLPLLGFKTAVSAALTTKSPSPFPKAPLQTVQIARQENEPGI